MKFEFSKNLDKSRIYTFSILLTEIIGVTLLALMFAIPLVSVTNNEGEIVKYILLQPSRDAAVYFVGIAMLMLYLFCLIATFATIPTFFRNKDKFIVSAKKLTYVCLGLSLLFFITSYVFLVAKQFDGFEGVYTQSYVLFIVMCIPTIAVSILEGLYRKDNPIEEKPNQTRQKLKFRAEPLIFSSLFTLATVSLLFVNLISVKISSSFYSDSYSINGLTLLRDYSTMSSIYQVLAFVMTVIYIVSAIGLLFCLTSFFSRSKDYVKIAKATSYVNLFFVFIIAVASLYFTIGQKMNEENIKTILAHYGVTTFPEYDYKISSQTLYILAADVLLMIGMFIRKTANEAQEVPEIVIENVNAAAQESDNTAQGMATSETASQSPQLPELTIPTEREEATEISSKKPAVEEKSTYTKEEELDFDPCAAFTEIDGNYEIYKRDLKEREEKAFNSPTLKSITEFVVEYAKESEQHLSYTKEDIATFIAGLGASKLAILQGMSGTGKTSLPKIFCEAVFGRCEVVEVESSWKDKNELIGYYNEFSRCFTPKKFTQCLYKAALNNNVITFIVLDEMNLSRIEYYFSDFLSLMEHKPEDRIIKLLNVKLNRTENGEKHNYLALKDGHSLKVPENVWFIGTANRDESTFEISDKVYDRAQTMNFNKRAPKVRDYSQPIPQKFVSFYAFNWLLDYAREKKLFDAEKNEIIQKVEQILQPYNISFGNRILKQMEEFVSIYCLCFNSSSVIKTAVEKILLSKVVAKLEVKIVEDKEELAAQFKALGLDECARFILNLNGD